MKKIIFLVIVTMLLPVFSGAEETTASDPNKLFYVGNSLYEKGEYAKAAEEYLKIIDLGVESSNIYYNIGNAFFKMGKIGYAILCYEKARRLKPGDSDLKSNLDYAKSFVDDQSDRETRRNILARFIRTPFRSVNLNGITAIAGVFYLILVILLILGMKIPGLYRKLSLVIAFLIFAFIFSLSALGLRYYNEEFLKRGIVIVKFTEVKYEPIDKASTYFTLNEGTKVTVLKTRNGWRQIRRFDGETGWVPKDAVQEI